MARRINRPITVAAGTPVNLATGTTQPASEPVWAWEYFVQMKSGGSGKGLIYDGVPASRATGTGIVAGDLTVELAPAAGPVNPGGSYDNADYSNDRGGIDINEIWIDGSHTGDVILASFVPKV